MNAGDWHNYAISVMSKAGVVRGFPDGTFRPDANITRAELAAVAARFAGAMALEQTSSSKRFNDIAGHWAENDILYAASVGWLAGYEDGAFKPD